MIHNLVSLVVAIQLSLATTVTWMNYTAITSNGKHAAKPVTSIPTMIIHPTIQKRHTHTKKQHNNRNQMELSIPYTINPK